MSDIQKLKEMYLFRSVPEDELRKLCVLAPPVQFRRGVTVFQQGDVADVALLIIEGQLTASVQAGAALKRVGDIRPGEIVGETALYMQRSQRNATVTADRDSTCLLISPDVMNRASGNQALVAIERHLLGSLARRIRGTNQAIKQIWKAEKTDKPTTEKTPMTLGQRLKSFFGGLT